MFYGWARTAAVVAMTLAVAACGRDAAPGVDPVAAENLRASEFFMTSNARADGVQTLPSGVQYKVLQAGPPEGERPDGRAWTPSALAFEVMKNSASRRFSAACGSPAEAPSRPHAASAAAMASMAAVLAHP